MSPKPEVQAAQMKLFLPSERTAAALALIERSPLNAFATWRRFAALSSFLPRPPRAPAPTSGPPAGGNFGILP